MPSERAVVIDTSCIGLPHPVSGALSRAPRGHLCERGLCHDGPEPRGDWGPFPLKPAATGLDGSTGGEDASPENRRTFDGLENLEESDLVGRAGKRIAADGSTVRRDEIVPLELLENASEKVSRDVGGLGNVLEKHDATLGLSGQDQQPLQRILAFAFEHEWSQKTR
jgi:hypothetical protein